jgi:hypothetical protein
VVLWLAYLGATLWLMIAAVRGGAAAGDSTAPK